MPVVFFTKNAFCSSSFRQNKEITVPRKIEDVSLALNFGGFPPKCQEEDSGSRCLCL